ncbi:unnamed protein product [Owenia fusiformis]|uniref:Uncharacterized protein n=1 Tax=Owenia fusiformis TaxID=6347 RepID=A0A8J1Y808_OWEFU|nr:unnamed protein product [Owenia fusiformis]
MLHSAVFVALVGVTFGQLNPGQVCVPTQGTPSQPTPKLEETFQTRLECNFKEKGYTMDVEEYFDYGANRGMIRQRTRLFDIRFIYSYMTREMFLVDNNSGSCTTIPMTGALGNLMGKTTPDGKYRMFSANEALKMITKAEEYKGTKYVRGMLVDWWYGCFYQPENKASMIVNFYFNAKNTWDLVYPGKQFPVQIHVKGKLWRESEQKYIDFENFYNFFQYRPQIEIGEEIFQTDRGIVCAGRKVTIPPPEIPQSFSFKMEVIGGDALSVNNIKEWYDFKQNLFRVDVSMPNLYKNPIEVIHDYSTGVSYVIDKVMGNCSYSPIGQFARDGVPDPNDPTLIRIRDPREFFRLDSNYTYEGQRVVRDVKSDVWIGVRPMMNLFNLTYEWYFTQKDVKVVAQKGLAIQGRVPWKVDVTLPNGQRWQNNIYDFAEGRQSIFDFNISPCYLKLKRADFQFTMDASWDDWINKIGLKLFRYNVLISIQANLAISPIRISNLRLDKDMDGKIQVTFTLLDAAPIKGSTITIAEVPIEDAVTGLTNYIKDGSFKIIVLNNDATTTPVNVLPESLKKVLRVPCDSEQTVAPTEVKQAAPAISTGAFAGIAIAMLIVGILLGVGGLYGICLVRSKKAGDDMHVQFKNEDATQG